MTLFIIKEGKMKKLLLGLMILIVLVGCATVPLSGRRQLNLIPVSTINSMSFQQYDEFLNTHKLSKDKEKTEMIKRVGKNIQMAVEEYFAKNNMSQKLTDYSWEFNLVEDESINAWCMPGGKVVFYTGILELMDNEAQVAVVMGHEIAHAIAEHGNERMSQTLLTQMGGMALAKALEEKPAQTQAMWMGAYGLGAQLGVMLPFSRTHEYEADHLGLIFMAMAGYNPEEAIVFWKKMAEMKQGQSPPEFISTHPSDANRIAKFKEIMPEVKKYYKE
jgi:predicted Zn-dependent protease